MFYRGNGFGRDVASFDAFHRIVRALALAEPALAEIGSGHHSRSIEMITPLRSQFRAAVAGTMGLQVSEDS
jgi:hypothetical protein